MNDTYQSVFSEEIRLPLCELCDKYCIDPESGIDSENYFKNLIKSINYTTIQDLIVSLEKIIKKDFIVMNKAPHWIQGSDWQFNNGKPMIFIGQISKGYNNLGISCDMVFYVFYDPTDGCVKTIIQTD